MKKTLIGIITLATLGAATPALAGSVAIEYRDLNLASVEGQKVLERRVDRAARQVCGMDRVRTGTRIRSPEAAQCYAQAKKQAFQQVSALVDEERLGG